MSAAYDSTGVKDGAMRAVLRRLQVDFEARNLRGLFAARPTTAPYGAWYRCDDATPPPAGHGGEVYWYSGAPWGWLLMFGETGGSSPGAPGSDTQVIFNDGGSFGADAGFTYNKTTESARLAGLGVGLAGQAGYVEVGVAFGGVPLGVIQGNVNVAGVAFPLVARNKRHAGDTVSAVGLKLQLGGADTAIELKKWVGLVAYSATNWESTGGMDVYTHDAAANDPAARWRFAAAGHLAALGAYQFQAADGTVALPAVSFYSDPDLGMYRIGSNVLGFSAGNLEMLRLSATLALLNHLQITDSGTVVTLSRA